MANQLPLKVHNFVKINYMWEMLSQRWCLPFRLLSHSTGTLSALPPSKCWPPNFAPKVCLVYSLLNTEDEASLWTLIGWQLKLDHEDTQSEDFKETSRATATANGEDNNMVATAFTIEIHRTSHGLPPYHSNNYTLHRKVPGSTVYKWQNMPFVMEHGDLDPIYDLNTEQEIENQ